ncbi:hypothetical protein FGKAn22_16270 [Ferrigenium kumadai]|uniref:Uncharacterized protein n=1 Tax=Ferrigenium kumadai TaxID=1682490 RepID=A0AAN1VZZ4_9PROT|nr:hypothetical protein [Ferrigenium kumadai]BBI99934.1 hypothetical protein FGKAn22_16270 [Ferrigenium kumadai]
MKSWFGWTQKRRLFCCTGRQLHLGIEGRKEPGLLAQRTRATQIAGSLSLGERGISTIQNATLVANYWGQRDT